MTPSKKSMEETQRIFKVFAIEAFSGSERAYDVEKFNKLMGEAAQRTALALDLREAQVREEVITECKVFNNAAWNKHFGQVLEQRLQALRSSAGKEGA